MIEPQIDVANSYVRLRLFLETEYLASRRLTAEWVAGRLVVPLGECRPILDRLAREGLVSRHSENDVAPWFEIAPPAPRAGMRDFLRGVAILACCVAIVALSTLFQHIFFFAVGLALGLLIAFAWLDWELGPRK